MINKTRTCSITENSAILQEMLALPVRDTLADYFELSPNVSRGGMGTVYFCRDKRDEQFYALKTYQTTDPKFKDLFLKEAEFALGLEKHPNIVYTRTVAMEEHTYYMVMDLVSSHQPKSIADEVKGNTLAQELAHKIPLEQALKWAVDLCHGMEYLNSKGMVAHGDLKPSNLFITSDKVLKVGDFGTVVLKGEKQKGGTLKYSSPEFEKKQKVDVRSDIYSFGIILYEMLNRGLNLLYPTRIGDKDKKYYQRLSRKAIQKSQCAAIISKCLEKDPKKRYANFAELRKELEKELVKINGNLLKKIKLIPLTAEEYAFKGTGWIDLKKYQKAKKYCDKAFILKSDYAYVHNNYGLIWYHLKQYEKAIESYTQSINLDSNDAAAYSNRGNAWYYVGNYSNAISDYKQAIKLDPQDALAYNNLGNVLHELKKYKEAIANYNKAIMLKPRYEFAYNNRGLAYNDTFCYKRAIKDYNKAISLESEFAIAYYNRGNTWGNLGKYNKALADYNHAISLNPKYVYAYGNRGNVLQNLGRHEEAIQSYNQALLLNPQEKIAIHNRGNSNKYLKRYKRALADYNKVIVLDSTWALAYWSRGNVKTHLKDYVSAIKDYDKAIKLNPQDFSSYNNRGCAKENMQCYEEAIADYSKAIKLNPRYVIAYNNRAEVLIKVKKYLQAERDFKKVLSLDKNNRSALEQLLKLYQTQNKPCNAAQIQKRLDKLQAKENFQKSCAKRKQNSK